MSVHELTYALSSRRENHLTLVGLERDIIDLDINLSWVYLRELI